MMKLSKVFTGVIALSMLAGTGYAQIVNVKEVAKQDADSRANNNIENGVDNTLGKAENGIKGLFKKKKKPADTPPAAAPAAATTTATTTGTANTTAANQQQGNGANGIGANITAYNNYDFIPGDQIIFADDFADDQDGEFPAHWNLGRGQAVINNVGGKKAFLLTDGNYAHVSPRIKSPSYLNDPFTIEFDTYSAGGYEPNIYLYNTTADATAANNDKGAIKLGAHSAEVSTKGDQGIELTGNFPSAIDGDNYLNKWHHVAIAFKKGQLKVYVDQYRVLVVPNLGFTPHAVDMEGIGDANAPIVTANWHMANGGGMNMLGKKFTDAKIVTHGINFDIDKASITPESMGTLNMIAGIMKDNPDLRFEIDGHTDNTGTASHNMLLSQQRAAAVMYQLILMGIDGTRMIPHGFGDTKPMADNLTPEGKANNRRVEFVKL